MLFKFGAAESKTIGKLNLVDNAVYGFGIVVESVGGAIERIREEAFRSARLHDGKSNILKLGIHLKQRKSIRSDLAVQLGGRNKSRAKFIIKAGGMLVIGREENMVDFAAERRRITNRVGAIIANGMLHGIKAFRRKIGNMRNNILVSSVIQIRIAIIGSVAIDDRPILKNFFIEITFRDIGVAKLAVGQKEGSKISNRVVATQVRVINKIRKDRSKRA